MPAIISFFSVYIFTRLFTTDNYGIYSLILSIILPLTTVIVQWGVHPLGRYYSEYFETGKSDIYKYNLQKLLIIVNS